jgi:hypothetical protein
LEVIRRNTASATSLTTLLSFTSWLELVAQEGRETIGPLECSYLKFWLVMK